MYMPRLNSVCLVGLHVCTWVSVYVQKRQVCGVCVCIHGVCECICECLCVNLRVTRVCACAFVFVKE